MPGSMTSEAKEAMEKTHQSATSDLEKQIETLKKDVASLTHTLAEYGRAQRDNLAAAAAQKAGAFRDTADEALHRAQEDASRAYEHTERKIRENPAAAVGIAAGIGFLIGLLAVRR